MSASDHDDLHNATSVDPDKRFHDHCLEEIARTFVATIGEALAFDPFATSQVLLARRVECNHMLALHPTIVVDEIVSGADDTSGGGGIYAIGALGLLNGIISKLTGGYVLVCETAQDTHTIDGNPVTYERVVRLDLRLKPA